MLVEADSSSETNIQNIKTKELWELRRLGEAVGYERKCFSLQNTTKRKQQGTSREEIGVRDLFRVWQASHHYYDVGAYDCDNSKAKSCDDVKSGVQGV